MDTERMFLTDEGFSLTYEELLENDLEVARHFIEVTRHLQEIHYLFLIFINNIDKLQKEYVLMNNGDVFYRERAANDESDYAIRKSRELHGFLYFFIIYILHNIFNITF